MSAASKGDGDATSPVASPAASAAAPAPTSLDRVVLGRTGLEVRRMGFGGIPIQRVSEAEAVATVLHVVEQGCEFIDTSRAYSTSERRIGLALKEAGIGPTGPAGPGPTGRPADGSHRLVLASKSHAKTADAMRADLETSLRELQRDYIDIYKCHFVSTHADYEKVIGPGGALEALLQARDEGLVGHIGITGHSLEVLDRSLDDGLFDVLMVCFGILEPKARETIIPKARDKNVGVLAMKPFSGGIIDNARLALKYTMAEPGVLVLVGLEHPDLFDEDWRIFQEISRDGAALTASEQAQIAELQQTFDKVFCRRCDYCQPCAENIPIQTVLGMRSMIKRMGPELLKKGPFWPAIQRARNCTECGECVTRCPYDLPIPDLLAENLAWLDALEG
jgi:uncharacterized protein